MYNIVPLCVRNSIFLLHTNIYTKKRMEIHLFWERKRAEIFSHISFGGWGKSIRFFRRKQCEISLFIP